MPPSFSSTPKRTSPDGALESFRRHLNEPLPPLAVPPVLSLAIEIDSALRAGQLEPDTLAACITHLTREGLETRAQTLAAKNRQPDFEKSLRALIESLARPPGREGPAPFESFRPVVERIHYGFVLTAHPTFSLTADQNRALSSLANALSEDKPGDKARKALWKTLQTPFAPPDLDEENTQALEAITNIRQAAVALRRIVLDVAARHYPEDWTALRPALCSIATWVGFDLDGRSDILWTGILARRMLLQILQIEDLTRRITALSPATPAARRPLSQASALLSDGLIEARSLHALFTVYDPARDPDHEALQKASRAMIARSPKRLTRPDRVITLLQDAQRLEKTDSVRKDIGEILALLHTEGMTYAQVHFRVNAVQIHNAIRKHVDLTTHPADPRFRQTYLDRILRLLGSARPCPVHFGNILEEQASARRLFMIVQQIVKHIDAHSPIRFLIAETESALTVLGALYLARRFGVEDHVDLCPLFETERALEEGSRIIDTLLETPDFLDWVRRRGRLCIQTGYSDAGRYIGQSPACASIERLKERIVRRMADLGLTDIDLLFFDTHGESLGRGGHPGDFGARLDYVAPPAFRALAAQKGVRLVQETSYQGGDGYLPFLHPEGARAVVTRVMTRWLEPYEPGQRDPYYDERGAVTEFLTIIKQFQATLMNDPDYGALLSVFGPHLMRPAGSRAVKRQHEGPQGQTGFPEAREFRAIPHNAILAQMGVLVNSACGFGTALSEDPALFHRMMRNSPRFQSLAAIPLRAYELSDPNILQAYILTLDPGLWLTRQDACAQADPDLADRYGALATRLETHSPFVGLHKIFRIIKADLNALSPALKTIPHRDGLGQDDTKESLAILHAIRIALIHRIFSMAMDIPDYSRMHDIPREELIRHVFRLDLPTVLRELDEIFPVQPRKEIRADYGEPSGWSGEEKESYAIEHKRIFQPMARMHDMILDTSTAIAHTIGFVG